MVCCDAWLSELGVTDQGVELPPLGSQQSQSDSSSHWEVAATGTAFSYGRPSAFHVTLDHVQLGLFNQFC